MSVRVLLADDHALVRSGLRSLLKAEPDVEVVGEAGDGLETLRLAHERRPQLVVLDLSLRLLNGLEVARRIGRELPAVRVLCVSTHSEGPLIAEALRAGVWGYVLKSCSVDELLRALRAVAAGLKYISPAVTSTVLEGLGGPPLDAFSVLTPREREVLQLLAEGHRTKQIASRLQLSVKTVGTYRERLLRKIGVDNVAGLTRYAIAQGLTPPA